jgi:3-phosphoglycerate kinase
MCWTRLISYRLWVLGFDFTGEILKSFMYLQVVPASGIPDGWMGLDIGPDSIKAFNKALDATKTIIWNGPMGVFEFEKFAAGTEVWITSHLHWAYTYFLHLHF